MLHLRKHLPSPLASLRRRSAAIFILLFALALNIHVVAYANASFTVTLVDGKTRIPCHVYDGETVGEFLARLEKMPGELDSLSHELEDVLELDEVVTITRREYVIASEVQVIPYQTIYSHSPDVKPGDEIVTEEGADGKSELTYGLFIVNGDIVEKDLISERVIEASVAKRVHMGFRSIPVSKLDFDVEFNENHEPASYTMVLRDQRSAGYSAKPGAGTASGIAKAGVGYVAVNPKVIPYGSKLFIQSADGQYIYGYAIAADTGTALMDGRIAVDCFYGTYQESADHGIQTVDIFVLE